MLVTVRGLERILCDETISLGLVMLYVFHDTDVLPVIWRLVVGVKYRSVSGKCKLRGQIDNDSCSFEMSFEVVVATSVDWVEVGDCLQVPT